MALFLGETASIDSFVVITGLRINFIPRSIVIKTEKLPIVAAGTKLEI